MTSDKRLIFASLMGLMPLDFVRPDSIKNIVSSVKETHEILNNKPDIHRFTGNSRMGRQIRSQNQSQVKHTELTKDQKEWNDAIEVKKQLKRERKLNGTRY